MNREEVVQALLVELLESGSTVEQVCANRPDLIDEVRLRWRQLRDVQNEVDELFPASSNLPTTSTSLPSIPGYVIEAELGRGGMGVVYRARQERLQRTVAIKMLLVGGFASARDLARFRREAELVAQLCHPNIVAVHDYGEVGGQPFYVMELMNGLSLAERLKHDGPMTPYAAARLAATLARAIDFAHQQGIVHRDLKPANILSTADGTPKIGDFGLAQRLDSAGTSVTGPQVGTPAYMAPEQASGFGNTIGPAADVHALGVVLYELLVGQPPFRADTPADTMRLLAETDARGPRATDRRVPRDLDTICLVCLRKEPHRRYASAALLADDLERFANGSPILARRTSRLERAWLWTRRRPALAAALACSALLAAVLLAMAWSSWSERSDMLRAIDADLAAVDEHARSRDWPAARAALRGAEVRLGERGPTALRTRLAEARADLDLVAALEQIRFDAKVALQGRRIVRIGDAQTDATYARLLGWLGVDDEHLDVATAVARLRAKITHAAVAAALDDWALRARDPERRRRLLAISSALDPAPNEWRQRARDPSTWEDRAALEALVSADLGDQPVSLLVAFADRVHSVGGDVLPLMQRVLAVHPDDFWANLVSGLLLGEQHTDDALRYLQAAVALRPEASLPYHVLGLTLAAAGRLQEGEVLLRRSLEMPGVFPWARNNLAICLLRQRRYRESQTEFELAIAADPSSAKARAGLASTLGEQGKSAEAMQQLLVAEALDDKDRDVQAGIGLQLYRQRRLDEALVRLDRAVASSDVAESHLNRALVLHALHRPDDALAAVRRAIELEPTEARMRITLAQILRELGFMPEALAAYRDAIRLAPGEARMHVDLGAALGVDWQFDAAIDAFRKALDLAPDHARAHGGLATALLVEGRFEEAVTAAKRFVELAQPDQRERAVPLLAQAERLLAAAGAGVGPDDTDLPPMDRFAFARRAARADEPATALRWYESAFAVMPETGDVRGGVRFQGILAALRAGAEGRARALAWLREDLAFRTAVWSQDEDPVRHRLLRGYAVRLAADPAFAEVHDAARLADLPPDERDAWLAWWRDFDAWLRSTAGS